jgi:hypothetical protein
VPDETWQALIEAVRRSASARLLLLGSRSGFDQIPCPWQRFMGCGTSCRCQGDGTVTVGFLRRHYTNLANDIAALVLRKAR